MVASKVCLQTFARLAAAYGEEDVNMSVEELEDYAKAIEPELRASSNKLRTLEVDIQVLLSYHNTKGTYQTFKYRRLHDVNALLVCRCST